VTESGVVSEKLKEIDPGSIVETDGPNTPPRIDNPLGQPTVTPPRAPVTSVEDDDGEHDGR
jgi:hypothetical protein